MLALFALAPADWRFVQQERVFDALLRTVEPPRPMARPQRVVQIDIDEQSLHAVGRWPWKRETLAALLNAIASASPAVIAVDVVFAGADTQSTAALARKLGAETGRKDLSELAASLPDGDQALAHAMDGKPVVLGWIIDPNGVEPPPAALVFLRGEPTGAVLWHAAGSSAPRDLVASAAAGTGTVSLPGDPDGIVRRVPLLVRVGSNVFPGFSAEVLRVSANASAHIVTFSEGRLQIGPYALPLPVDGLLRLVPRRDAAAKSRMSASSVLADTFDRAAIKDSVVFVGGSAAEAGGLRATADDPLTPSTDIHAAAFGQIAAGIAPLRPSFASWAENFAALAALGLAVAAATFLRPLPATVAAMALFLALIAAAGAAATRDVLLNPAPAVVCAGFGFAATLIGAFSQSRLREARLRRRFEQHLAPGIVERIVADPGSLRLTGERRVVTALFTDIEGFTTTARDTDPVQLIAVLDGYFEGVSRIVVEHGGMVDKFVGDAVHAFFNLPFDTEGHCARAVACGQAIAAWTDAYRGFEPPKAIALGRTRIGIEAGPVVAGDVGLSTKLDYTAHGSAVNLAARLEAMNKEFGTSILIGPEAARSAHVPLRSLGLHNVRGFGAIEVFTLPESAKEGDSDHVLEGKVVAREGFEPPTQGL